LAQDASPLFANRSGARTAALVGLMVPFQETEHEHAQRAFELVVSVSSAIATASISARRPARNNPA
jgi:hypothetical protein